MDPARRPPHLRHIPRRRPEWWPPETPWPPQRPPGAPDWHKMRRRFLARAGLALGLLALIACGGLWLSAWLALRLLQAAGISTQSWGAAALALALFAGLVLALLLINRLFRYLALPFGELVEAAGKVAGGDYSVRLAARGPRELRSLGRAFNTMVERLQLDDQQRRMLLADISHELRTPLTVIQGELEGLLDGVYPRDDAHLQPILDESRLLARLVDDLRTLSLAESGALELQRAPVDPAELLGSAAAAFEAQASAAGISLEVEAAPGLPALEVDAQRIQQVLANLLSNALRYTPPGGSIRLSCDRAAEGGVEVQVRDSGAGIPPEDLPHIFERFYKSPRSSGAGLGLAIARSLVQAHGGQIRAESRVGEGTCIAFSLPVE